MKLRDFLLGRPMQVVGFGVLVWAIPLVVSLLLSDVREHNRLLFKTIMPVVLTAVVCVFGVLGFGRVRSGFVREGLNMGLTWMLMGVGLDMGLFWEGPMSMPMAQYFTEIGPAYLIHPIILLAMGGALQNRFDALLKSINEATIRGLQQRPSD